MDKYQKATEGLGPSLAIRHQLFSKQFHRHSEGAQTSPDDSSTPGALLFPSAPHSGRHLG